MSMLTTIARSAARAARVPAASFSLAARSVHTLPPLDYPYDVGTLPSSSSQKNTLTDHFVRWQALEPHISGQIMELHHLKHHQAYVNGLNAAEDAYAKAVSPRDRIRLQPALKFNGGGHINHTLFWKNLAPSGKGGGELPAGPLKQKIEADFGSVEGTLSSFGWF